MINRNFLNSNVLPLKPPASITQYGQNNDIPHPSNTIHSTPITPSAYDGVVSITLPTDFVTGVTAPAGKIPLGLEVGDIALNIDFSNSFYGSFNSIESIPSADTFVLSAGGFSPGATFVVLLFKPGCRGGAIFEIPEIFGQTCDVVTVETMGGITQTFRTGSGGFPQGMPLCRKLKFEDSNATTPADTESKISTSLPGFPLGAYLLAFYN